MTKPNDFRVEKRTSKGGDSYYLVIDVRVGSKGTKISKLITKDHPPTKTETNKAIQEYGAEMQIKAGDKYAEFRCLNQKYQYVTTKTGYLIERIRYAALHMHAGFTIDELAEYEHNFELNYVHGTTAIEGNTISLYEARRILENGIIPDGKTLREINEVQNYKMVKQYRDTWKKPVSLEFIKGLHNRIVTNIDTENAGVFRRTDGITINGYNALLAPSILIEDELQALINNYYEKIENGYCVFEQIVLFHHRFEQIHPFTDGNGRTGREIFNYMLLRDKYPRLIFPGGDKREKYIKALGLGDDDRYDEMVLGFVTIMTEQYRDIFNRMAEDTI